jgi:acetyl esterase
MSVEVRYRELLELVTAGSPPVETLTADQARKAQAERRARMKELTASLPTVEVADWTIRGPAGPLPVRTYRPVVTPPRSTVVYFHGGGWVLCDLDTHDPICRELAFRSDVLVVSVGYRLAPEHKFPAAVEDAYAATLWVSEHRVELGEPDGSLVVAGDSAGGNLAAAVCLMARDRGRPVIRLQVLIYPVLARAFDNESYREFGDGPNLVTRSAMEWYWEQYLPSSEDGTHALASPLLARTLAGLPSALIIVAGCDPLRDEGEAYARRLEGSGVDVRCVRFEHGFHGFLGYLGIVPEATHAHAEIASTLSSLR